MGLEAINYFFRSKEPIQHKFLLKNGVVQKDEKKFVCKKEDNYWIDIEFQDQYSLSIRITLCNPQEAVLEEFHNVLSFLFNLKDAMLIDMNSKKEYKTYDNEARRELEKSFLNRKKVFESIYGSYTAAISSEEFYKRLDKQAYNKNKDIQDN